MVAPAVKHVAHLVLLFERHLELCRSMESTKHLARPSAVCRLMQTIQWRGHSLIFQFRMQPKWRETAPGYRLQSPYLPIRFRTAPLAGISGDYSNSSPGVGAISRLFHVKQAFSQMLRPWAALRCSGGKLASKGVTDASDRGPNPGVRVDIIVTPGVPPRRAGRDSQWQLSAYQGCSRKSAAIDCTDFALYTQRPQR